MRRRKERFMRGSGVEQHGTIYDCILNDRSDEEGDSTNILFNSSISSRYVSKLKLKRKKVL